MLQLLLLAIASLLPFAKQTVDRVCAPPPIAMPADDVLYPSMIEDGIRVFGPDSASLPIWLRGVSVIECEGVVVACYIDGLGLFPFSSPDQIGCDLLEAVGGSTLTTEWTDAKGRTQKVVTPCGQYSTPASCARAHADAVRELEALYPPLPKKEDG